MRFTIASNSPLSVVVSSGSLGIGFLKSGFCKPIFEQESACGIESTGGISGFAVKNLLPESEQMLYTCFNIRLRADTS